jgi:exodeoxyribonuclease V alpha subunit
VVIDEASMVDLPMMAKLMQALHSDARLILLGDKDQLASVEAGAVLGSICFTSPLNHFSDSFLNVISMIFTKTMNPTGRAEGVWDSIIELRKNYRFSETSDLRIVSQAVKNGNGEQVLLFLRNGKFKDVRFYDLHRTEENISEMLHYFMESYREYLDAVALNQKSPEEIFMLFENFRILCALRSGYWGIERVNRLIEKFFIDQNLLFMGDLHYAGQPLMILQNDYVMNLFNGDVGIVLEDKEDGNRLKAYFQHDKEGMRKVSLERLPRHETAWAMTVHKSQGSEYNEISLILSDFENPVLTKELVYTGLTRARESVSIWSSPKIFLKAINNRIVRHSGLADALKQ